ncbi:tellurite resistance TerB family protein [Streptomyces caniscabiei]|uniref:TerB family tellurite resistance protein n=1 Tax=Streptomyces caniscabiei TaxID=2746961 RepID=A0A927L8E8_9ACTN|nr:TerB family tellurite resistance protein [Streptomyces caniscabiei]MBD9701272.1 TerB family tellurite resistance protein [Streptomyces caniscabiei]MBD9724433.1 TerB family tellurite resistance protein [Streptomyces caniscabiei]MDX3507841.1 TerB family tellurite resistance protein [Streptomyces caniscabiei]MDX3717803.1 TerB family tellurite resistance protein [Streptomyces caniscabiei]MDX3726550.1 TerB family tellurite resistance protein [Streptomyces caniscabiei]
MAMWDQIKNQAKGLQQQAQGARGGSGHGQPGAGPMGSTGAAGSHGSGRSSGGSKAQLVSALKSQLTSLKTELKSGAYRDASMAMCALVAAADGNVDPAERQHVESLILNNDVLQNFPADQLRQRFNRHVDQLSRNFQQGKAEALTEIAKAAKKPTEARAVVQTGFVVAGADGYIAQTEEQVLREACATLGLSPQEFGL